MGEVPGEAELEAVLRRLLRAADLTVVSSKLIRQQCAAHFGVDLGAKKGWLKARIVRLMQEGDLSGSGSSSSSSEDDLPLTDLVLPSAARPNKGKRGRRKGGSAKPAPTPPVPGRSRAAPRARVASRARRGGVLEHLAASPLAGAGAKSSDDEDDHHHLTDIDGMSAGDRAAIAGAQAEFGLRPRKRRGAAPRSSAPGGGAAARKRFKSAALVLDDVDADTAGGEAGESGGIATPQASTGSGGSSVGRSRAAESIAKEIRLKPTLAAFLGVKAISCAAANQQIWSYIRERDLVKKKGTYTLDERLAAALGRKTVSFKSMSRAIRANMLPEKRGEVPLSQL